MITVLIEQFLPDKEKRLVCLLYLFVTSFKITHHHWATTKQWLYISKGIKHLKLIFHIYFNKIAFSWDQFLSFLVFGKSRQIKSCLKFSSCYLREYFPLKKLKNLPDPRNFRYFPKKV